MDRREDSETKKDVSSPGKKSEAATVDSSSTKFPTPTPLHWRAEKIFALRWSSADKLHNAYVYDKLCRKVWTDYELLEFIGGGKYGRIFLVKHKATETKMALKLCSMMRIARGRILTDEMAKTAMSDFKHAPSKFDGPEVEAILKLFRAERLVLRCPSDLCPFVMDIDEQSTHQCICDDVDGELGFPMRPGVGDLFAVWSELNDQVKEKKVGM